MAFDPVTAALDVGDALIKHFFPNPTDQEKAKAELLALQQKGELQAMAEQAGLMKAQLAVNQSEAAKGNMFVAGWRPFIGWVCGAAFAWNFVGLPMTELVLTATHTAFTPLTSFDLSQMMPVLIGMLGLGGYRTFEKMKGVNSQHG